ncbi:MAG: hypothetical protein ACJ0K4_11530 [Verrucomicrobiales bacterium]|nr:MAG: hypothetical protein EVB09_02420 [Verrucomicrobiaceae bacterium]
MHRSLLLKLSALGIIVVLFFGIQTVRWSGEKGAKKAHKHFIQYLSDRRWSKCSRMISELYDDQWKFNRNDISLALRDFGRHFYISLSVDWKTMSATKMEGSYAIKGAMKIKGSGSPAADYIIKEARPYLIDSFTFIWSRSGIMPWSWKLEKIKHPSIKVPPGYVPGDQSSSLKW